MGSRPTDISHYEQLRNQFLLDMGGESECDTNECVLMLETPCEVSKYLYNKH